MTTWSLKGLSAGYRNRFILFLFLAVLTITVQADNRAGRDLSDMNRDGIINEEDVQVFWDRYVHQQNKASSVFSWCAWLKEYEKYPQYQYYRKLFAYIYQFEECGAWTEPNPLAVKNRVQYPTRMGVGPSGEVYVSDFKVGSIFIFDLSISETSPIGEIKGLEEPLGLAVSATGKIYVGERRTGYIKQFDADGKWRNLFGIDQVRMPNDIACDRAGNVYVADSKSNIVWVYNPYGRLLQTIRTGSLQFPSSVEIAYVDDGNGDTIGELFVADKDHYLVKVYDLAGNYLREFGGFPIKSGMMGTSWDWEGRFVSMADLVVGPNGNLFVLDNFMLNVQELDPVNGGFIRAFGESGSDPGQMKLPIDMLILPSGELLVTDAGNKRLVLVEVLP